MSRQRQRETLGDDKRKKTDIKMVSSSSFMKYKFSY